METRRAFGGFHVRQLRERAEETGDRLIRIPNDNEADLAYARDDARELLARGQPEVLICRSRLKLPSGIVGYRYFAIDHDLLLLFPRWRHGAGPNEVVERYQTGEEPPHGENQK